MKKSVKKAIKKNLAKTKKKSNKRKFFYIQAVLTLLVAVYLIMSGISNDKSLTGNVIGSGSTSANNPSFSIFLMLGMGLGLFALIEMIVLLITAYA